MSKEGVKAVIKEFGTQKKLAEQLNTTQQHVASWLKQGFIPDGHAVAIALVSPIPVRDYVHPNIAELIRLSKTD